ncbi:hypothetical protein BpHYR1_047272 [Brachionus plicatilis]|uniref:Uncharacterized protein n=1 Tax=Brachionus plicatilis TaxID=10195 RepID=A0A3M7SHY2_BRAPC|nr:hypothetical protein BpHYR1_047272 [Brachionus plicatilis]
MSEASSTSVLLSDNNQENQLDNTDNDVEEIEQVQAKHGSNTVYDEYTIYSNFAKFINKLLCDQEINVEVFNLNKGIVFRYR